MVTIEPNYGLDVVRTVRGFPEVEQLHATIGVRDLVLTGR
ncbi:hypothetical protein A8926_5154 [Saccharopolyspora spinosa]|uniref:Uncharacterized protein n=1 Tax=Saccharopolyspora spinosa TaxID=60894 RepID=A0A2N3Y2R1_SACSN|nr:hypothetical protein A8926_5154 [Saccharopolyspora spinosa]